VAPNLTFHAVWGKGADAGNLDTMAKAQLDMIKG